MTTENKTPEIPLLDNDSAAPASRRESVTLEKPSAAYFRIADFATMETPPIKTATFQRHMRDGTDPDVRVRFGKTNGNATRYKASKSWLTRVLTDTRPHFKMQAEGDDAGRGEQGSIHFFVYLQKLNAEGRPVALTEKTKEGELSIVMTAVVPKYNIPFEQVGNEKHADGVRRLIVEIDTVTGVAVPKSLPSMLVRDRQENVVSQVVKALSVASELQTGQVVGNYEAIESIERLSPTSRYATVKFAAPALTARQAV